MEKIYIIYIDDLNSKIFSMSESVKDFLDLEKQNITEFYLERDFSKIEEIKKLNGDQYRCINYDRKKLSAFESVINSINGIEDLRIIIFFIDVYLDNVNRIDSEQSYYILREVVRTISQNIINYRIILQSRISNLSEKEWREKADLPLNGGVSKVCFFNFDDIVGTDNGDGNYLSFKTKMLQYLNMKGEQSE